MSDPVLEIGGIEVRPYLHGDSAYRRRPYLLKSSKTSVINLMFNNKKKIDEFVNSRVVIEHAFVALNDQWNILKICNMNMDKAITMTLACHILHNLFEIYSEAILLLKDVPQLWIHSSEFKNVL